MARRECLSIVGQASTVGETHPVPISPAHCSRQNVLMASALGFLPGPQGTSRGSGDRASIPMLQIYWTIIHAACNLEGSMRRVAADLVEIILDRPGMVLPTCCCVRAWCRPLCPRQSSLGPASSDRTCDRQLCESPEFESHQISTYC